MADEVPTDLLTRKQAAEYLRRRGYLITTRSLGNLAYNNNAGGGPAFYKEGKGRTFYAPADLDKWRNSRLRRVE